jgi:hypothetical protein
MVMRYYASPFLALLGALAAGCQPSVEERAATAKEVIDRYCTDCHNEAERTGELTLERVALTDVGAHAEVWEAVVRKLRGRMMPPAGEPLPEAVAADELVAYLEEQLDLAAATNPNPGRKSLHRLNRTEYGNAIRDLLALDIDASAYLPNDSEAYGFDNIADVLGTDPSLMDRYLSAAWKITSAAMGDTDIAAAVSTYRVPPDRSQRDHVEGLPLGTRGGMLVSHYFPVDGEYVIRPKLWRNTVDVVRGTETPHDLEVSLDGAQLSLTRFGGPEDEVAAQMFPGKTADEIDRRFETTVLVAAGRHDVGVTFAKKSSASRQDVLQAFEREKHDARMDVGIPELDQIVIEGPLTVAGPGRAPSRERIFSCEPKQDSEAATCAEQILTGLALRAYRRPITDAERDRLLELYNTERTKGRDFTAGVQTALAYILVSPQFLFRVEQDPAGAAPGELYRISGLELASRLSFFLWGSVPDDELIDAAVAGKLESPQELTRQVRRMLADERATTLATTFASQWLYLRNLRASAPDMYVFPDFDDNLRQSAIRETELLFETVVREDRPLTELLSANYTFLNERLAKHYGIPDLYGDQFRRVTVTDERRYGLLGHASILTLSSYPNRTSPVSRGNYVLTNILGTPPPEPPPNVPTLPENTAEKLSMRARMERHRADPVCASCHQLMDPIGLVLESYDGIGRWRTEDNGDPVSGYGSPIHVLRDFGPIDGPVDLRNAILSQPDRFARTATEKLMTYALGRQLTATDMPTARAIVRSAAENDYRFSSLVLGIVTSDAFQMRIAGERQGETVALDSSGDSKGDRSIFSRK